MNVIEHLQPTKVLEIEVFGIDASIYNSTLSLFFAVFIIFFFFMLVSRKAKIIPTPIQSIAEYLVDFIRLEMLAPLGSQGEKWLPFLISLFCLILISNLLGLVPGLLPPTSNINVTGTLAIIVFIMVNIVGLLKHGFLGYFRSFIPSGVPIFLIPLLFPIEVMGQVARPFSLAVRLFANMFAGHAIILVFLSFIFMFKSFLIAPLPVIGDVAISAFEIFVAFIQAFIFTYLSSSYIIGALQEEH
ncbi:MAG: F0F1 ATP synthase subunit A [Candidatus Margulisbacteria bacterium]|nr:F0F1 ATP synthase subunit A [Candidatus Margulisiibacteriota bacterium]